MNVKLIFFALSLSAFCVCIFEAQSNNIFGSNNVFESFFLQNAWHSKESVSGSGSELRETEVIRSELPKLLKDLNVKIMLDAACGDLNWIKTVELPIEMYIGVDVVPGLILTNKIKYKNAHRTFMSADIAQDALPYSDLIFCRDCLVHNTFESIAKIIKNFKRSGAKYLLTTTFTYPRKNVDIKTGYWRPINLQLPPFNFPQPLVIINEKYNPAWHDNVDYSDKSMALWRLEDL